MNDSCTGIKGRGLKARGQGLEVQGRGQGLFSKTPTLVNSQFVVLCFMHVPAYVP